MISALLRDARTTVQKVAIVQGFIENSTLWNILTIQEKSNVVSFSIDLMQNHREHKVMSYGLFIELMERDVSESDGLICGFLERLSSHIETLQSLEESKAFNKLLVCILESSSEEIQMRIEKLLTKFLASGIRLCQDKTTHMYGIGLLQSLVAAKANAIPPSTIISIKSLCLDSIHDPMVQRDLAKLLATSLSSSTAEVWTITWGSMLSECVYYLTAMGIERNDPGDAPPTSNLSVRSKVDNSSGVTKTTLTVNVLKGLFSVLYAMMYTGNTTTFVSLDIGVLLRIASSLLLYQVGSLTSAQLLMENHHRVSPAVMLTFLPDIQLHFLNVLRLLISTYQASLARHAGAICKILSTCLAANELTASLALIDELLATFEAAVVSFPPLIVQTCGLGLTTTMALFSRQIDTVTSSRVSIVSDHKTRGDRRPICSPDLLFKTLDSIVVYCGYSLSGEHILELESAINKALLCMLTGVFPGKLVHNRKIQRSNCEILREDTRLQVRVLTLASNFIQHCHRDGVLCGSIPVLKRCCENAFNNPPTRYEATRILSLLDIMLMPTAIAIPLTTLQVTVQNEISRAQRNVNAEVQLPIENGQTVDQEIVFTEPPEIHDKIVIGDIKRKVRDTEEPNEPVKYTRIDNEIEIAQTRSKIEGMFGASRPGGNLKSDANPDETSDDESLPEINM